MADYPSALPSITRPDADDKLGDPGVEAYAVFDEIADELEAVAAGLGLPDGTTADSAFFQIHDTAAGHSHDGVDSRVVSTADHDHSGDAGDGGVVSHDDLTDTAADHHEESHDAGSAAHFGFLTPEMRGLEVGLSSADQTFNLNAVLANLTDLDVDVVANGTYLLEGVLWISAGTTGDFQIALTGPSSPTRLRYQLLAPTESGTGFPINFQQNDVFATAFGTALNGGGVAGNALAMIRGLLVNGSNSGIVRVQGAQKVSNATDTIFRAGSYLRAERIA